MSTLKSHQGLTSEELACLSMNEQCLPLITQKMLAQTRLLAKTKSRAGSPDDYVVTDALPMEGVLETGVSSSESDTAPKRVRKPQPTVHRKDPYFEGRTFVKLREYMTRNHPIDWDHVQSKPTGFDPDEKIVTDITKPKRTTTLGLLPYVCAVFGMDNKEAWPSWVVEANQQILSDPVPKASRGPKKSEQKSEDSPVEPVLKKKKKTKGKEPAVKSGLVEKKSKKMGKKKMSAIDKMLKDEESYAIRDGEEIQLRDGSTVKVTSTIGGQPIQPLGDTPLQTSLDAKHLPPGRVRDRVKKIKATREARYINSPVTQITIKSLQHLAENNKKEKRNGVEIPDYLKENISASHYAWIVKALNRKGLKDAEIFFGPKGRMVARRRRLARDGEGNLRLDRPLEVGRDRNAVRGFDGGVTDEYTANRPMRNSEIFNVIQELNQDARNRDVFYTFRFQGNLPSDVSYRSFRAGRLRTLAQFNRAISFFLDPDGAGSESLGTDSFGEVFDLDRTRFSIFYKNRDQAPNFFAHPEGFGDPPVKSLPGPPLMNTLSQNEVPHAKHCFDAVCQFIGVPFYSAESGSPLAPTKFQAEKHLKTALSSKYGLDSPLAKFHYVHPWSVQVSRFEVKDLVDEYGKSSVKWATPDQCLILKGKVHLALQPWHIWRLYDEKRELGERGPILLAYYNNHVEFVPCVYDATISSWVPQLREVGRYFISPDRELWYMSPFKSNKDELDPHQLPPFKPLPVIHSPVDGHELTIREIAASEQVDVMEDLYRAWDPEDDFKPTSVRYASQKAPRWKTSKVMSNVSVGKTSVHGLSATVYYDFETVYNVEGRLIPYSCAYLIIDNEERDTRLVGAEEEVLTAKELEDRAHVILGQDCAQELSVVIRDLALLGMYESITLTGFNSAKFDAFLLMEGVDSMSGSDMFRNLKFVNHFFMSGALLGAQLSASYSTMGLPYEEDIDPDSELIPEEGTSVTEVHLSDMAKHLVGMSLEQACKKFNLRLKKKKDLFEHSEVQAKYEEYAKYDGDLSFLEEWEGFKDKLLDYNKYDVISLAELEAAYRIQAYKVTSVVQPNKPLPLTAGSICLAHWKADLETRVLPRVEDFVVPTLPDAEWAGPEELSVFGMWEPLNLDAWTGLRTGIVGGRVQLPNGPLEVEERVSSLDVTSLYPATMVILKDRWFPCGSIMTLPPGRGPTNLGHVLGVYNIDVDQTALVAAGHPTLVPRKEYSTSGTILRNNWDAPVVYDAWVTTPTLMLLLEWGAQVTYRKGYEWTHKIRNIDLFDALKGFLKGKKRQDELPEGHPEKNSALRNLMKLYANGTYGMTLKGIFERSVTSMTPFQLERLEKRMAEGKIASINVIQVRNERVFVDFTRHTEDRLSKQGPFIVGAFVLGYSREYLARFINRVPPEVRYYYDTDSIKIPWRVKEQLMDPEERVEYWPELLEEFPGYATTPLILGTEVGCWTEEFPEDNTGIVILFKKGYVGIGADGISPAMEGGKPILSIKGVRRKDVILPQEVRDAVLDYTTMSRDKSYKRDGFEMLREHFLHGTNVVDGPVSFFRSILQHRVGYVVGSVLHRVSSNSHRGVSFADEAAHSTDFGQIYQTFRIKKLAIHPPQPEEEVITGKPYNPENELNTWERYRLWLHRDIIPDSLVEGEEASDLPVWKQPTEDDDELQENLPSDEIGEITFPSEDADEDE